MVVLACGGPAAQPAAANTPKQSAPGGAPQPSAEPVSPDSSTASSNAAPSSPSGPATSAADPSQHGSQSSPSVPPAADNDDFTRQATSSAKTTHGVQPSSLQPTKTEALVKFVVVDRGKSEPIAGIVILMEGPDGTRYHTKPTDAVGFAELLVPAGQDYQLTYLSLRGKDIAAKLSVENKERFTLKLTLRYKGWIAEGARGQGLVLDGVEFDTGKATIRPSSYHRLDHIVEYMTHHTEAQIEIAGHTDNVGSPAANQALSQRRAEACRAYLISKGVDGTRLRAAGYGDTQPIASNKTAEGRQKNRRITAKRL